MMKRTTLLSMAAWIVGLSLGMAYPAFSNPVTIQTNEANKVDASMHEIQSQIDRLNDHIKAIKDSCRNDSDYVTVCGNKKYMQYYALQHQPERPGD